MSLHGWDDLAAKLHRMSKEGRWNEMTAEISDDLVHEFAAVATYANVAKQVEKRFGGLVDAIALPMPEAAESGLVRDVLQDLRRIPSAFRGFATSWGDGAG